MLMSLSANDRCEKGVQAMTRTEQFSKLFCELEGCRKDEQMQKIEEMNRLIEEMDEEEFQTVFTVERFNEMGKMIEKKTLSLESAILLLKHVGYCKMLKMYFVNSFDNSSLSKRIEKMITKEEKKTKEKDEKLLIDLSESYLFLGYFFSTKLISICVPYLLKVALKKEGNEEAQKEVEIALLALSNVGYIV
ncbi:uncharacterized protein MONOS_17669 [Monocercomonoides exilis]|uniref:uncharacterized protein n=1 Tax=Monocercomonoides exilis TaxID=2049356 RepID=UPI00355A0834|nr:hypothetical protein MONOS_17669 [Monocercomonoides exilis]